MKFFATALAVFFFTQLSHAFVPVIPGPHGFKPPAVRRGMLFQTLVSDPKGILAQSDAFLGARSFEQDLHAGDAVDGIWHACLLQCDPERCHTVCESKPYHDVITLCDADRAVISSFQQGRPRRDAEYRRDFHSLTNGNPLRELIELNSAEPGEEWVLQEAQFLDYPFELGGTVRAMKVEFTIRFCENKKCAEVLGLITMGQGLPWLSRMLMLDFYPRPDMPPLYKITKIYPARRWMRPN